MDDDLKKTPKGANLGAEQLTRRHLIAKVPETALGWIIAIVVSGIRSFSEN